MRKLFAAFKPPTLVAAALVLSALASACGDDDSSDDGANLLVNPGFEDGADPWITLDPDTGFVVSEEFAQSGSSSALLPMRDDIDAEGANVYYLVQELTPAEFPDVVRGFYRVENWRQGTPDQYLQMVIIAFGPSNFPAFVSNYQLRYLLAGIDSRPFGINNAQFVFVSEEEPVTGEWVPFELNVKDDFLELWEAVPENFEKLRLLFEVRWDNKVPGSGVPEGDVYYDDLYVGPAD